ncbi:hypothetical protein LguiB_005235 [Lonicera macranthoides]
MEGEMKNCIVIWSIVFASLCYCHAIAKFIPKGTTRLVSLLPIIFLFFFLPLNLSTIHLAGLTSFFIAWLCNFKLLLFAFGLGPLSSTPPLPLSRFVSMASLPIKIQHKHRLLNSKPTTEIIKDNPPSRKTIKKGGKSPLNYATKIVLLASMVKVYDYKEHLHQHVRLLLYCFHIYFMLEMILALFAAAARATVRVELEPQFDEPYLATSLQDFWGKRWNLMVSSVLRPSVYDPVSSILTRVMPRRWAAVPAVMATFVVSGIMHELIFYYIGRLRTTWDVTWFFVINGVCLGAEIGVKKVVNGRFRLPVAVSRPLTLGFVLVTAFWFFFPPFMRFKPDVKGCTESVAFIEFVRHGRLVSPANVSCPFL